MTSCTYPSGKNSLNSSTHYEKEKLLLTAIEKEGLKNVKFKSQRKWVYYHTVAPLYVKNLNNERPGLFVQATEFNSIGHKIPVYSGIKCSENWLRTFLTAWVIFLFHQFLSRETHGSIYFQVLYFLSGPFTHDRNTQLNLFFSSCNGKKKKKMIESFTHKYWLLLNIWRAYKRKNQLGPLGSYQRRWIERTLSFYVFILFYYVKERKKEDR